MFRLYLCGFLIFLGLVNSQLDTFPGDYAGDRTQLLGHTRHRDVVNGNGPIGSQPFSGRFGTISDPLREGLVTPDRMFIDLGTQNESPFTNFGGNGRRTRMDEGHHHGGGLDNHGRGSGLGRAHDSLDIVAGRRHGDQGLGLLPGDTNFNHRLDGQDRHHEHSRGGGAGQSFGLWNSRQNGLGVPGGQLAPEASWRDLPGSPIGANRGSRVAAHSGDHLGGDVGGSSRDGHEISHRNRRPERGRGSERNRSRDTSRNLISGVLAGLTGALLLG